VGGWGRAGSAGQGTWQESLTLRETTPRGGIGSRAFLRGTPRPLLHAFPRQVNKWVVMNPVFDIREYIQTEQLYTNQASSFASARAAGQRGGGEDGGGGPLSARAVLRSQVEPRFGTMILFNADLFKLRSRGLSLSLPPPLHPSVQIGRASLPPPLTATIPHTVHPARGRRSAGSHLCPSSERSGSRPTFQA
jgi:hypothetical protein